MPPHLASSADYVVRPIIAIAVSSPAARIAGYRENRVRASIARNRETKDDVHSRVFEARDRRVRSAAFVAREMRFFRLVARPSYFHSERICYLARALDI